MWKALFLQVFAHYEVVALGGGFVWVIPLMVKYYSNSTLMFQRLVCRLSFYGKIRCGVICH